MQFIKNKINKLLDHPMRYRPPGHDVGFLIASMFWVAVFVGLIAWGIFHPPSEADRARLENRFHHVAKPGKYY